MLRIAAGAMLALLVGPAAMAQNPSTICPTESQLQKATKEFVENYQAASAALGSERYGDAIIFAEAASPHARDARQAQALLHMKAVAYVRLGDKADLASTLDVATDVGCMSALQRDQIEKMRSGLANMH